MPYNPTEYTNNFYFKVSPIYNSSYYSHPSNVKICKPMLNFNTLPLQPSQLIPFTPLSYSPVPSHPIPTHPLCPIPQFYSISFSSYTSFLHFLPSLSPKSPLIFFPTLSYPPDSLLFSLSQGLVLCF